MAKKKKKKRQMPSPEEYAAAKAALRDRTKSFNGRLALGMLGAFVLLALAYYILLSMQVLWVTPVLYTLAAVLFIVFFFVNGGFSRETVTRELLPADWSEARIEKFLSDERKRKALARKIMIVMTPVLLVVLADMVILFILPVLK